jgi:hypothetical protein
MGTVKDVNADVDMEKELKKPSAGQMGGKAKAMEGKESELTSWKGGASRRRRPRKGSAKGKGKSLRKKMTMKQRQQQQRQQRQQQQRRRR